MYAIDREKILAYLRRGRRSYMENVGGHLDITSRAVPSLGITLGQHVMFFGTHLGRPGVLVQITLEVLTLTCPGTL